MYTSYLFQCVHIFVCISFFSFFFPTTIRAVTAYTHVESMFVLEAPFFIGEACLKGFSKGHFLDIYCFCPSVFDSWLSVFAVQREEQNLRALEYNRSLPSVWTLVVFIHPRSILDRLCLQFEGKNISSGAPKYNRSLPSVWASIAFTDPWSILYRLWFDEFALRFQWSRIVERL